MSPNPSRSPMFDRIRRRMPLALVACAVLLLATATSARASEADLAIPDLHKGTFNLFGTTVTAWYLLLYGAFVICGTLGISLWLRRQIRLLPAHKSMLDVAEVIYATCKTYLVQQGKFLLMLFALIAIAISYYLLGFGHKDDARPAPQKQMAILQAESTEAAPEPGEEPAPAPGAREPGADQPLTGQDPTARAADIAGQATE